MNPAKSLHITDWTYYFIALKNVLMSSVDGLKAFLSRFELLQDI